MRTKWFVLLVTVFAALALWGCGSNGGSGGSDVSDSGSVETVGIVNCSKCHSITSVEAQSWLTSTHGNPNDSPSGVKDETSSCQPCHNQLLDGEKLPAAYIGEMARNIVSCESCHGGGSAHRGVGPIPFPQSTWELCGPCHDNKHGLTVGSDFTEDNPHLKSLNEHVYTDETETAVRARCSKCHSDEGARRFRLISGDHDQLVEEFEDKSDVADASAVECRTCHKPHGEETPLLSEDEVFTGSTEYNTCTNCHQLTYSTADGGAWMQDTYHAPPVNPYGDYGEIISDTHYDDPATGYDTGKTVEGYVVKNAEDSACSDCHNLHSNDNTINNQWARSGHGGYIMEAKEAAEAAEADVFAVGSNDDGEGTPGYAPAWTHYDWDDSNGDGPAGSSRSSCQECHTATGASNYLNDPDSYDSANNDFGHLTDWTANGWSPQNELLYCWGCHSDATNGELRNPGAVARPYTVDGVQVVLPDVGNSNTCINCHGARGNVEGYELPQPLDPSTDMSALKPGFGPGTKNVTEAHYLVAAATIYASDTVIGYEYAGQDYAPVPYFAHDGIALNGDAPETGNGPCAACHMETAEPHLFEVVTKDESGVITELNSTACIVCHDGSHGPAFEAGSDAAAAFLEEEAEGYHEALEIVVNGLAAVGIDWTGGYPYFSATTWVNEGNFGAAHNYNYLHHEPGAYAHNRFYAKRLLFDSIDWLDNYFLDGTITVDTATYPEAAHWFGADEATGAASRP
jgi:hypothetical protein